MRPIFTALIWIASIWLIVFCGYELTKYDNEFRATTAARKMECLEHVMKSTDMPAAIRICQLN